LSRPVVKNAEFLQIGKHLLDLDSLGGMRLPQLPNLMPQRRIIFRQGVKLLVLRSEH
jgi:hypothetical protein